MNGIKFSICIPNYNYSQFIGKTIESVLNQTYQNFEIIISDNASDDDSISVIESFKDGRISLIRNKYNVGFSPNLDRATYKASGDYIILLSSDDLMKPNALEEYNSFITRQDDDQKYNIVIMSDYEVINSAGEIQSEKPAMTSDVINYLNQNNVSFKNKSTNIFNGLYILKGLLKGRFQPAGPFMTTCYSRFLYNKIEGYNSIMSIWPDAHFSHKLLLQDPKVVYIHKTLFCYRIHSNNNLEATQNFNNINHLIDGYKFTSVYDKKNLTKVDLSVDDIEKTFVKNLCLIPALFSALRGRVGICTRTLAFSFSAFPALTMRNGLTYLILAMIPFFFLFNLVFRIKRAL